jgi:voltage-gated potassium channel
LRGSETAVVTVPKVELVGEVFGVSKRWGRLVRVARVLRVLRGVRSMKVILGFLFASRAKGAVVSAVLACVLLLVFSSVAILHL